MELKNYQKLVLKDLEAYLDALMNADGINAAWKAYWAGKGMGGGNGHAGRVTLPVGVPSYHDDLDGAPNVCIKVPTGGGKTFLAASSVKAVFDKLPTGKTKSEPSVSAAARQGLWRARQCLYEGAAAQRPELQAD